MKALGTFTSKRWGTVTVLRGNYGGAAGPTAIVLQSETGEPLATLSVNMYRPECSRDSQELPADCFFVKQWGGNESIAEDALASGLFTLRADLGEARSGYVAAPVWQIAAAGATFPAVFTMHCPAGKTNACVKHARGIETLFGRMFGLRIPATPAPEGSQCDNCVNEAKVPGAGS